MIERFRDRASLTSDKEEARVQSSILNFAKACGTRFVAC